MVYRPRVGIIIGKKYFWTSIPKEKLWYFINSDLTPLDQKGGYREFGSSLYVHGYLPIGMTCEDIDKIIQKNIDKFFRAEVKYKIYFL